MTDKTESTDLIVVPAKEAALEVFKADGGLTPYLNQIRAEIDTFLANQPGLDTAASRKQYGSMANKVARSKTAIDSIGKELVAELKEIPKKIDAERKTWRDTLDAWKAEVRAPLTEWEQAEADRVAKHQASMDWLNMAWQNLDMLSKADLSERLEQARQLDTDCMEEFAEQAAQSKSMAVQILENAISRREQQEAEAAELERLRQEKAKLEQEQEQRRLADEAAARAKQEAAAAIEAEKERARIEREAAIAEHEEKTRQLEEAHQRALEQDRLAAKREAERLAKQEADAKAEAERRAADKEHRTSVNRAAVYALTDKGLPEPEARHVITLIAKGMVPGVTIHY